MLMLNAQWHTTFPNETYVCVVTIMISNGRKKQQWKWMKTTKTDSFNHLLHINYEFIFFTFHPILMKYVAEWPMTSHTI